MEDYKKLADRTLNDLRRSEKYCLNDYSRMAGNAANLIENILTENAALRRQIDNLTSANAVVVKEFEAKLEELHEAKSELNAMRNELCFKCGNYRESHNGACDGCRWKKEAQ